MSLATTAATKRNSSSGDSKHGDDSDEDETVSRSNARSSKSLVSASGAALIADIDWYDGAEGYVHQSAPTLAIAYMNGTVQIGRSSDDPAPVLIDTQITLRQAKWNSNGTVLALSGTTVTKSSSDKKEISVVKFYSPFGELLRVLKVPGTGVSSLSWEGGGLRIALAVDAYIYFANIRPDYTWAYAAAANVLVFSYQKPDRVEACVAFWDLHSQEKHVKLVKDLKLLRAAGENALLISGPFQSNGKSSNANSNSSQQQQQLQHSVTLCNAIGSALEVRQLDMCAPKYATMTQCHIVVADERVVYVWQYKTPHAHYSSTSDSSAGNFSICLHYTALYTMLVRSVIHSC
jgi:WD repeat-containing protein 35